MGPPISPASGRKTVQGFEGLDVGDRIRIQLKGTDAKGGFIDFG